MLHSIEIAKKLDATDGRRLYFFTSVNKPLEPNVIWKDRLSRYVLLSSLMSSACCLTRLGRLRC